MFFFQTSRFAAASKIELDLSFYFLQALFFPFFFFFPSFFSPEE